MQLTPNHRAKTAFTLIELLVVIAIIAILAAILFPVFARARENARRASCQSNLRQIGLGVLQYTQDYDEKYPSREYSGATPAAANQANSWRRQIYPYLKSAQIFACPSNTYATSRTPVDSTAASMAVLPAGSPVFPVSYVINGSGRAIGGTPVADPNTGVFSSSTQASTAQPSEIILVSEYAWTDNYLNWGDGNATNPNDVGLYFHGHLGTSNFLFCDGHVKALKPTATAVPTNMWNIEANVNNGGTVAASDGRVLIDRLNAWTRIVNR